MVVGWGGRGPHQTSSLHVSRRGTGGHLQTLGTGWEVSEDRGSRGQLGWALLLVPQGQTQGWAGLGWAAPPGSGEDPLQAGSGCCQSSVLCGCGTDVPSLPAVCGAAVLPETPSPPSSSHRGRWVPAPAGNSSDSPQGWRTVRFQRLTCVDEGHPGKLPAVQRNPICGDTVFTGSGECV